MSAVLRAYGEKFDVDAFLDGCTLPVCAVKRRGEPLSPVSKPHGNTHQRSGIHVTVSNADFCDFPRQAEEAIEFLRANAEQVRRLCGFPAFEIVTLDFGIARRDVPVQCDSLPAELIRLAGTFGLVIELSQYASEPSAADSRIKSP